MKAPDLHLADRKRDLLRVAAFLVVAAAVVPLVNALGLGELLDASTLRGRVDELGRTAWAIYLGAWVILVVFTGQSLVPTVAGGILFGWVAGGFAAVVGATIACTAQFLVVRYALRGPAERLFFSRFPRLMDGIEDRGLGLLVLLRYLWAPLALVNIAAALSQMPLRRFVLAFPALLPQALLYCLVSDSLYTFGWRAIPLERWGLMAALVLGGLGTYWIAVRRWPELRSFVGNRRGSPEPD